VDHIQAFILAHPFKAFGYAVGGILAAYLIYILIASIVVLSLAAYASYGKSDRARRVKNFMVDWQFVADQMRKATPEKLAQYGGKRGYRRVLKASIAMARFEQALKETAARAKQKNTCNQV
jgi:hypothetical protein